MAKRTMRFCPALLVMLLLVSVAHGEEVPVEGEPVQQHPESHDSVQQHPGSPDPVPQPHSEGEGQQQQQPQPQEPSTAQPSTQPAEQKTSTQTAEPSPEPTTQQTTQAPAQTPLETTQQTTKKAADRAAESTTTTGTVHVTDPGQQHSGEEGQAVVSSGCSVSQAGESGLASSATCQGSLPKTAPSAALLAATSWTVTNFAHEQLSSESLNYVRHEITSLSFLNGNIQNIADHTFSGRNITVLSIVGAPVRWLGRYSFANLAVSSLNISMSGLQSLPYSLFSHGTLFYGQKLLTIADNAAFHALPADLLKPLSGVRVNLSRNSIQSLPSGFIHLHVAELDLSANQVQCSVFTATVFAAGTSFHSAGPFPAWLNALQCVSAGGQAAGLVAKAMDMSNCAHSQGAGGLTAIYNCAQVTNVLPQSCPCSDSDRVCEARDIPQLAGASQAVSVSECRPRLGAQGMCQMPFIPNSLPSSANAIWQFGTSRNITCRAGYSLVGASTIYCLIGSQLDAKMPTCLPQPTTEAVQAATTTVAATTLAATSEDGNRAAAPGGDSHIADPSPSPTTTQAKDSSHETSAESNGASRGGDSGGAPVQTEQTTTQAATTKQTTTAAPVAVTTTMVQQTSDAVPANHNTTQAHSTTQVPIQAPASTAQDATISHTTTAANGGKTENSQQTTRPAPQEVEAIETSPATEGQGQIVTTSEHDIDHPETVATEKPVEQIITTTTGTSSATTTANAAGNAQTREAETLSQQTTTSGSATTSAATTAANVKTSAAEVPAEQTTTTTAPDAGGNGNAKVVSTVQSVSTSAQREAETSSKPAEVPATTTREGGQANPEGPEAGTQEPAEEVSTTVAATTTVSATTPSATTPSATTPKATSTKSNPSIANNLDGGAELQRAGAGNTAGSNSLTGVIGGAAGGIVLAIVVAVFVVKRRQSSTTSGIIAGEKKASVTGSKKGSRTGPMPARAILSESDSLYADLPTGEDLYECTGQWTGEMVRRSQESIPLTSSHSPMQQSKSATNASSTTAYVNANLGPNNAMTYFNDALPGQKAHPRQSVCSTGTELNFNPDYARRTSTTKLYTNTEVLGRSDPRESGLEGDEYGEVGEYGEVNLDRDTGLGAQDYGNRNLQSKGEEKKQGGSDKPSRMSVFRRSKKAKSEPKEASNDKEQGEVFQTIDFDADGNAHGDTCLSDVLPSGSDIYDLTYGSTSNGGFSQDFGQAQAEDPYNLTYDASSSVQSPHSQAKRNSSLANISQGSLANASVWEDEYAMTYSLGRQSLSLDGHGAEMSTTPSNKAVTGGKTPLPNSGVTGGARLSITNEDDDLYAETGDSDLPPVANRRPSIPVQATTEEDLYMETSDLYPILPGSSASAAAAAAPAMPSSQRPVVNKTNSAHGRQLPSPMEDVYEGVESLATNNDTYDTMSNLSVNA